MTAALTASVTVWYGTFLVAAMSWSDAPPRICVRNSAGVMPRTPAAAVRPSRATPGAPLVRCRKWPRRPHPVPSFAAIRALIRSPAAFDSLPSATAASTVVSAAALAAGPNADSATPRLTAKACRNVAQNAPGATAGATAGAAASTVPEAPEAGGATTLGDAAAALTIVPPTRAARTKAPVAPIARTLGIVCLHLRGSRPVRSRSMPSTIAAGRLERVWTVRAIFTTP